MIHKLFFGTLEKSKNENNLVLFYEKQESSWVKQEKVKLSRK